MQHGTDDKQGKEARANRPAKVRHDDYRLLRLLDTELAERSFTVDAVVPLASQSDHHTLVHHGKSQDHNYPLKAV